MSDLGKLINQLATKAGIPPDSPHLVSILSNAELSKTLVHSELATALENSLLSLNQAKNNHPDISNHYKAQALNAFDKRMEQLMEQSGLSPEKVAEISAVKNTYQRMEDLNKAMVEAATAKSGTTANADKTALQKQVDDLNLKLSTVERTAKAEIETTKANAALEVTNFKRTADLRAILAGQKTIYDTLPPAVKESAITAMVNQALQDKNAEFNYDENGNFSLKTKEGTNVVGADHSQLTPVSFIEGILAQNKVLVVNAPANPAQPAGQGLNSTRPNEVLAAPAAPKGNNQAIAAINQRKLESMQAQA